MAINSVPTTTITVKQKKRDGSTNQYACPYFIAEYNAFIGSLNSNDLLCGAVQKG